MSPEESEQHLAATTSLIDEIKALRDATEELFTLLEHIWQNREDLRFKMSVVVTNHGREAVEETLCCYECEAKAPSSLVQALHDGWIDITFDEGNRDVNFVGWCPACQQAYDERDRQQNPRSDEDEPHEQSSPGEDSTWPAQDPTTTENNSLRSQAVRNSPIDREHLSPPQMHAGMPADATTSSSTSPALGTATAATEYFSYVPSADHRQKTPLLTRLYVQRHMADIVRTIGYEHLSRDDAMNRIKPLIERYGRETIEQSTSELLDVQSRGSETVVCLKDQVRQLVRGILGKPPEADTFGGERHAAEQSTNPECKPSVQHALDGESQSAATAGKAAIIPTKKRNALRPVKITRREALIEFEEHLKTQGLIFERIDNDTRQRYTTRHLGALDFIIRDEGEPPELVTIRRTLSEPQRYDLKEWQRLISGGAFISAIWPHTDREGTRSWEVIPIELGS